MCGGMPLWRVRWHGCHNLKVYATETKLYIMLPVILTIMTATINNTATIANMLTTMTKTNMMTMLTILQ